MKTGAKIALDVTSLGIAASLFVPAGAVTAPNDLHQLGFSGEHNLAISCARP